MVSDPLVWPDLLLWHIGASFARLPLGVGLLALSIMRQRNHGSTYEGPGFSHVDQAREVVRSVSLCVGILNDLFLRVASVDVDLDADQKISSSTLDCSRTNTFAGTVVLQQSALGIANWTGLVALLYLNCPNANFDFYIDWFSSVHLFLGLSLSISILGPLVLARHPTPKRGRLWLNTKDLMAGEPSTTVKLSWFGERRDRYSNVYSTRTAIFGAQAMRAVVLAFVRRIKPVETKRYAIIRNVAALLAITALIVRAVTLLTQAQSQVFQTITRLEPCSWDNVSMSAVQIIMARPNEPDNISLSRFYQVNVTASWTTPGTVRSREQISCFRHHLPSAPTVDAKSYTAQGGDWFDVFTCMIDPNISMSTVAYDITIRANTTLSLDAIDLPQIWLTTGTMGDVSRDRFNMTQMRSVNPWLVPAWQMTAGVHSVAEVGMAERKFIDSPFFRDTVGGMKPRYQTVMLFPITQLSATPLSNTSFTSATLAPSKRAHYTPANNLQSILKSKSSLSALPQVCEVIEDYRASTAFDVFSSIGGLLALLQGLHILLFGRPMFWGIFGAKLISPFGLLGGWSSPGFRRRLREHYSNPSTDAAEEGRESMRLYAFLRDYVVDFGPADPAADDDV